MKAAAIKTCFNIGMMGQSHSKRNENAFISVSLACLEMSFVVKGAGAVLLLFRLEYKTSAICHNVNTQKVKIARRDRPHILAYILTLLH